MKQPKNFIYSTFLLFGLVGCTKTETGDIWGGPDPLAHDYLSVWVSIERTGDDGKWEPSDHTDTLWMSLNFENASNNLLASSGIFSAKPNFMGLTKLGEFKMQGDSAAFKNYGEFSDDESTQSKLGVMYNPPTNSLEGGILTLSEGMSTDKTSVRFENIMFRKIQ